MRKFVFLLDKCNQLTKMVNSTNSWIWDRHCVWQMVMSRCFPCGLVIVYLENIPNGLHLLGSTKGRDFLLSPQSLTWLPLINIMFLFNADTMSKLLSFSDYIFWFGKRLSFCKFVSSQNLQLPLQFSNFFFLKLTRKHLF